MSSINNLTAQGPVPQLAPPQVARVSSEPRQPVTQVEEKTRGVEVKVDAAGDAAVVASAAKAEVDLQKFAGKSKEVMQAAAQQIQGYLRNSGRNLNVSVDEVTGYYVAKVVNPETGEIVRTLPSEETLRIARNIHNMQGMLVNQRA